MIQIKVPARICFFGDHQDYLELPVIAGAINRFIVLTAHPIEKKEFQIVLKDIGEAKTISLADELTDIQKNDYFRSGMAVLKGNDFVFDQGFGITISGNIPLNAGLSSSSALVVAWLRFLIEAQQGSIKANDVQIGHWAYEAEVVFFEQPGGLMDQYSIAQQGLLYIDTKTNQTQQLIGSLGTLIVAESGIEKHTLDVLKNARIFQEKAIAEVRKEYPEFEIQKSELMDYTRYLNLVSKEYHDHWYASIVNYHITKKARALLSSSIDNLLDLARLMEIHQTILQHKIQNTPIAMTNMMDAAMQMGALAAKTIGSGGGGSMVAMVDDNNKMQVIEAFLDAGAKAAYEIELEYPKV